MFLGIFVVAAALAGAPASVTEAVHKGHAVGHEQDGVDAFARPWRPGAMSMSETKPAGRR